MSNASKLVELAGTQADLAAALGVHRAVVSRWIGHGRRGGANTVPVVYNGRIRQWARSQREHMTDEGFARFMATVENCLDPDVCPMCGQPLDAGRVA